MSAIANNQRCFYQYNRMATIHVKYMLNHIFSSDSPYRKFSRIVTKQLKGIEICYYIRNSPSFDYTFAIHWLDRILALWFVIG